ncbi:MAG: hypothetical protein WCV82_00880 [Candidatus Paceibacterota bacterium]
MISQEAIEKILGIQEKADLEQRGMAKKLTFTLFPFDKSKCSQTKLAFLDLLLKSLKELGIPVIPYTESLETITILRVLKRFIKIATNNIVYFILTTLGVEHGYYHIHPGAFLNLAKRHRIRKGVTVIAMGISDASKLAIDYTSSFTQNSIVTILDCPANINKDTPFQVHFDTAMNAFSYYMTQIVILVAKDTWTLYNFNASHPTYPLNEHFSRNILSALVPKVAAPIRPPLFREFIVQPESFDIDSKYYSSALNDFKQGGALFDKTNLYPTGKKVENLPFRSGFYKWIGKIHLDNRSGMSYGFLARQLPVSPSPLKMWSDFSEASTSKDYFVKDEHIYIKIDLPKGKYCLEIPPVWVLTLRSGSNKTHINYHKDIILLGLVDGKMYLRTPKGTRIRKDYKPSFDTKVILAHAVGNAIIASIMSNLHQTKQITSTKFVDLLGNEGIAIVHWHGYIKPDLIPPGLSVHGFTNPHVACSTVQSAIFALSGKLDAFFNSLSEGREYLGDVHIEPHHGTNINYDSIISLANFLLHTPNASGLGNRYLSDYQINIDQHLL